MQDGPATDEGLGGGIVVRTIADGVMNAAIDYWWFWLAMVLLILVAAQLNNWSRRVDARAKAERRARERAERQLRR